VRAMLRGDRTREPEIITHGPVSDIVACSSSRSKARRGRFSTLKYGAVPSLGTSSRALGELVAERGIRADRVIPVPLSKRKSRERGFNQAGTSLQVFPP